MEWFDFKLFLCWRARLKTFKRHNHWSQQHKENCRPGCPVRSIVYCSWAETGIMCLIKTGRKLLRMSQASKKTLDGCPRQLRLADWARQRWDCVSPWIEPSRLVGWLGTGLSLLWLSMLSCFSHRFIWTPTRKTPDPKVHFVQSLGQKPVEQLSGLLNLIDFFIVIVWHLTHSLVLPPALLMRSTYKPVPLKVVASIRATPAWENWARLLGNCKGGKGVAGTLWDRQ